MRATPSNGTVDYWSWSSLREIDLRCDCVKGSAFRVFKRLAPTLIEGVDFIVLDARSDDALAGRWHAAGRLYRSSMKPVLLSPAATAELSAALKNTRSG